MKFTMLKDYRHHYSVYALVIIVFIYLITLGLLQKRGFWNVDNANKFILLQSIIKSNYTDYSISWPGKTIDPNFEYNPIPSPFSMVKDHRLFSNYAPLFPLVSSFFYKICGFWGLYILPLVFAVLLLFGLLKTVELLGFNQATKCYTLLIAGLSTPLWFYSFVFWEPIIATSLGIWSIIFCLRFLKSGAKMDLIKATIVATLSIYFRDEAYLFCAVLLFMVLITIPKHRFKTALLFILTMQTSILPLWIFQWKTIGQIFGFHLGTSLSSVSGITEHILNRPQVFYNLFVASLKNPWLSFGLALPFISAFLLDRRVSERSLKSSVPLYCLAALVCSIIALSGYFSKEGPILKMLYSNSFFMTSPILIVAFLRFRASEISPLTDSLRKWLWSFALVYAIVYGLMAPEMTSQGIHWGNRFLLILYPLFAILCAVNLAAWWGRYKTIGWANAVVILTLLVSLSTQVYSITILHKKNDFSNRLNQEIQKRTEEIIVTNVWWVPQELFSVFTTRSLFYVSDLKQYNRLTNVLRSRAYKNILVIIPASKEDRLPEVAKISDHGLNFFDLEFFNVNLTNFQSGKY